MVKLEVFVGGLFVGAVCGSDRLDAYHNARKYFPDCTSVDKYIGHSDLVWVSENFALFNYSHQWS